MYIKGLFLTISKENNINRTSQKLLTSLSGQIWGSLFNAKNREVHIENKAKHQRIDTLVPIGVIAVNSNQEAQKYGCGHFSVPPIL